jgi:tetratricopeptide (TPR) repeat protein
VPDDVDTKVARASVEFHWKADTQSLYQTIDSIRATDPAALPNIANDWLSCGVAQRDVAAAKDALNAFGEIPLTDYAVHLNRPLVEGVIARMTNDDETARAAFTAARAEQEKAVQAQPNYAPPLCVLGLIDAALGRKEQALREGRRAVELIPVKKDAINGPADDRVFGDDRCMGWRKGSRLRTACDRHPSPEHCQLWSVETTAVLGSAAKRSVL